ncbi:hypothetical protein PtA15_4A557 [Puccinia triticina]|uniref:Uncharacterized protein n=1 Tax=Puccinia triticina TaxID=208348 RepID=A0ABY7CFW1_9BASI|nr:uncharacterized protein PtA15_4A557 [Puccinia triticina]WAQ84106.1 hypothetical protein PtA15_4A557 [Puccinia triticina]
MSRSPGDHERSMALFIPNYTHMALSLTTILSGSSTTTWSSVFSFKSLCQCVAQRKAKPTSNRKTDRISSRLSRTRRGAPQPISRARRSSPIVHESSQDLRRQMVREVTGNRPFKSLRAYSDTRVPQSVTPPSSPPAPGHTTNPAELG